MTMKINQNLRRSQQLGSHLNKLLNLRLSRELMTMSLLENYRNKLVLIKIKGTKKTLLEKSKNLNGKTPMRLTMMSLSLKLKRNQIKLYRILTMNHLEQFKNREIMVFRIMMNLLEEHKKENQQIKTKIEEKCNNQIVKTN